MKKSEIFKALSLVLTGGIGLLASCTGDYNEPVEKENYSIASSDYGILAEKSLDLMSSLDFDNWGSMLSDSVEYLFPDETQTRLTGKQAVLSWWKNYSASSGLRSMSISDASYLPVSFNNTSDSKELSGVRVIAYFSNQMVYPDHTKSLRMNFVIHFDKNKMIDAYYTYYDRTETLADTNGL